MLLASAAAPHRTQVRRCGHREKKFGGCGRRHLDEKILCLRIVRKKSAPHAAGADFFLRSNKPRLCAMKMFILRESHLTNWESRPIFPAFRPPRGALLREAFEGWGGMRYPCAWLATLTPGHVQRAAAG